MGFGGISIWQLLIVLAIVLLLFGTKRLKNIGGDLGGAVKGFKKAMNDAKKEASSPDALDDKAKDDSVIEGSVVEEASKEKDKS